MIKFNLKDKLKENEMTMTELHEITGISKNTLSLLSRGESQGIQFRTLDKICETLGCSPGELLQHTNFVQTWSQIGRAHV